MICDIINILNDNSHTIFNSLNSVVWKLDASSTYTLKLDSEEETAVAYNGKLRNQQKFVIFNDAEGVHAFNFNGDIIKKNFFYQ